MGEVNPLDNAALDEALAYGLGDTGPSPAKRLRFDVPRGETTFTVQDPDLDLLRNAPVPAEDGRWPDDPDERGANDARRFGPEWRGQMQSRRELLERDPNYQFLTLVAGESNNDVVMLYEEDSMGHLDRARMRQFQQRRAIEQAEVTLGDLTTQTTAITTRVVTLERTLSRAQTVLTNDDVLRLRTRHTRRVGDYTRALHNRVEMRAFLAFLRARQAPMFVVDDEANIDIAEEAWAKLRETTLRPPKLGLRGFGALLTVQQIGRNGRRLVIPDFTDTPFASTVSEPPKAGSGTGRVDVEPFVDDPLFDLTALVDWLKTDPSWTEDPLHRVQALERWLLLDVVEALSLNETEEVELERLMGALSASPTSEAAWELRTFLATEVKPLAAASLKYAYVRNLLIEAVRLGELMESGQAMQDADSTFDVQFGAAAEAAEVVGTRGAGAPVPMRPSHIMDITPALTGRWRAANLQIQARVESMRDAVISGDNGAMLAQLNALGDTSARTDPLVTEGDESRFAGIPNANDWIEPMVVYEHVAGKAAFSDADFPSTAADRLGARDQRLLVPWSAVGHKPPDNFSQPMLAIYAALMPPWRNLLDKIGRAPPAPPKTDFTADEIQLYAAMSGGVFDIATGLPGGAQLNFLDDDAFIFGSRLYYAAADLRRMSLDRSLERWRAQLSAVQDRIAAMQRGEPAIVRAPETPYEHRRGWVEEPENSGVVHMKAIVVAAIDKAWSLVKRWTSLGAHEDIDVEFMQHDIAVRGDFATLVAIEMAKAAQRFPKQYLQLGLRTLNDVDERSVMQRFRRGYGVSYIKTARPKARLRNVLMDNQLFGE